MVKRRDTADDFLTMMLPIEVLELSTYVTIWMTIMADLNTIWNDTGSTSTNFTVGVNGKTNTNGSTYVAYIFAHDDQSYGTDSDEAIIKCGTYESTLTYLEHRLTSGLVQFLLIKNVDTSKRMIGSFTTT